MAADWPPLLVIHGDADLVVSPQNGRAAAQAWADAAQATAAVARSVQRGKRHAMSVTDFKRRGATVIVITASGSPLAREAQGSTQHILLAADHPEDADRYSPMVSRLLHLLIVDILTTGVALRLGSAQLRPMLQAIKKNLRERRYAERQPERQPGEGTSTSGSKPSTP